MSTKSAESVVRYLRKVAGERQGPSDAGLLARFVHERDGAAYAALLERHGPMVLGVCRRILGNHADAEDAFQATFFILARTAARIRPDGNVAGWLHAVAQRTARKALARRRPQVPLEDLAESAGVDPFADVAWRDLRRVLDEELSRLPDRVRGPLVLCYLDGLPRDEAAQRLGWSLGTVKRRLEEGRELLRGRLARRGLAPALLAAATTSVDSLRAAVPQRLHTVTAQYALPSAAHLLPATVRELAAGGTWLPGKAVALALLLMAAIAGAVSFPASDPPAASAPPPPAVAPPPAPAAAGPRLDPFGDPLPAGLVHRLGSIRFRNANHMSNAAITADGRRLAVGSWEGITVYDLQTGEHVQHIKCNMENSHGGLSRLALSPDGKQVAYLGEGPVTVRDTASGKALYSLGKSRVWHTGLGGNDEPFGNHAIATLFSADGKEVIVVGYGKLFVYHAATGAKKREWVAPGYVLAVSRDRRKFAAFTREKPPQAVVGDMGTGKVIATFPIPRTKGGYDVAEFSPDGKILATVDGTAKVHLWDADTGKHRATYEAPAPERTAQHFVLESLAFTPDGRTLFAGSYKGIFRWDIATAERLPTLTGHLAWNVWRLFVTPDGKRLVAVCSDCTIRRWDLPAGTEVPLPAGYAWYVSIAYAPDGRTIAVADGSGRIDLRDPVTGAVRATTHSPNLEVGCLAFTPDGKLLAGGHADGAIRFWDADTAAERRVLRVPAKGKTAVAWLVFSPDGRRLLSGMRHGPVYFWDLAAGVTLWERLIGGIRRAVFSPDGKLLALGADNGALTLLDPASGKDRHPLSVPPPRPTGAFNADGTPHRPKVKLSGMTFSADGRLLTTCHEDGMVRVWETATGQLRSERKAGPAIWGVNFSPDGRWFVCADNRTTSQLYETATGKEIWRLEHEGLVVDAVFAPNGRSVLTATRANAYLWTLRPEPKGEPGAAELWDDLAGADAAKAYRAAWALIDRPALACKLLRAKLGGPGVLDAEQVRGWIRALDSKNFAERERAHRGLAALGRHVERPLREALGQAKSLETIRRIEKLLQPLSREPSDKEVTRGRALQVLELIGNAEARAALRMWAGGSPGLGLTEEARAALARLERRR